MKAAIYHAAHEQLSIEDVEIDEPQGFELIVRTAASGVCHSDLHFVDGFYFMPGPAVLGHEAAGVVESVGPLVTEVKPWGACHCMPINLLRKMLTMPSW